MRSLLLLCVYLCGVTTLEVTSVRDGVVLFGKERLLREAGQATIYDVIDYDYSAFATAIRPITDKIENYIFNLRTDMRPEVQRLLTDRLNRVRARSPVSRRSRRGLVNFIGQIGKGLFGLATEEDLARVQAGLDAIADQTAVLTTQQNNMVAVINKVGAAQIKQMRKVNELVNRTNALHVNMVAVSRYTSAIMRNITTEWSHMKLRTNIEYLLSDLESRARDFQELSHYMHNLKLSCEIGAVTEDLLPRDLLQRIMASNGNQNTALTNEWYYRTLKVETMFRDKFGRLVCRFTVPLPASEPYIAYNIHTYPTYHANSSFAVRLYHDVYVAIGTQTGELFYPEQCKGIDPVVCHAGLRYDKSRELCVRGLITGSPKQQSHCSISLHKSVDNSQSIKEVTRNKFVVHTSHEHYSYRCPGNKPIVGDFPYGTYVIEIEPDCLLDTSSWMLEGLTYHEIYQYFNISEIEIPEIPVLSDENWNKFERLIEEANVIDQLDVPSFNEIPTIPPMHVINEIKKPVYTLWYFWIILLMILLFIVVISWYLYHNRCISMTYLHAMFTEQQSDQGTANVAYVVDSANVCSIK